MRLVIVESPYAGEIERNLMYARLCVRDSLQRNEAPFASHLLYTQPLILADNIAHEREWGMEAGFSWGRVAEGAAFYVDLGWSHGMRIAKDRHKQNGLWIEERKLHPDLVGPLLRAQLDDKR